MSFPAIFSPKPRQIRKILSNTLVAFASLLLAYFFTTGPVTRFAPDAADKIYAPLSAVGDNKFLGPIQRALPSRPAPFVFSFCTSRSAFRMANDFWVEYGRTTLKRGCA